MVRVSRAAEGTGQQTGLDIGWGQAGSSGTGIWATHVVSTMANTTTQESKEKEVVTFGDQLLPLWPQMDRTSAMKTIFLLQALFL